MQEILLHQLLYISQPYTACVIFDCQNKEFANDRERVKSKLISAFLKSELIFNIFYTQVIKILFCCFAIQIQKKIKKILTNIFREQTFKE